MKSYPTFHIEQTLWKKSFENVCGIDEVGRGSWAGPIVAAAVVFDQKDLQNKKRIKILSQLNDSKQLTENKRLFLCQNIIKIAKFWGVGVVSSKEIDLLGIDRANVLAMSKSIQGFSGQINFHLIDGNNRSKSVQFSPSEFIVKGDSKSKTIAAASILAKVYRDQILKNYSVKYPDYLFHKHKGYGTKAHERALKKYGVLPFHRSSFQPIKDLLDYYGG